MSADSLNFDITLIEIPVTLTERKEKKNYILREATGEAACKWQNKVFSSTKIGPDGKPSSIGNVADIEPYLLSMCLFPVSPEGNTSPIPCKESFIRTLPAKVQSALYDKVLVISGLKKNQTKQSLLETIQTAQEQLENFDKEDESSPKA